MTHGTDGKVFDRVSMTWYPRAVYEEIRAVREEIAFQRRRNQGDLAAPMVIRDTMDPVQSMLDGKMYDSKRKLRRTYREGGVEEVGNDPAYTDPEKMRRKHDVETRHEKEAREKKLHETIQRGISLANLTTSSPGDDIKIKDWSPPAGPEKFHGMKETK